MTELSLCTSKDYRITCAVIDYRNRLFTLIDYWLISLPLWLKSSTKMISLTNSGGDRFNTLCTVRSNGDQDSSVKQIMMVVSGRSFTYFFFLHLKNKKQTSNMTLVCCLSICHPGALGYYLLLLPTVKTVNIRKMERLYQRVTYVGGRFSGNALSSEIISLTNSLKEACLNPWATFIASLASVFTALPISPGPSGSRGLEVTSRSRI